MAINYKSINYGLPGRFTKLPNRKMSTKKTIYSRCILKTVELFNPDPMPYQKDTFKPCTVSRFVDIPRRINDSFMQPDDWSAPKQRGIIIHKDRYDWSNAKEILSNQNDRLVAEENYLKKIKSLKKLSEQKLKSPNHNLILEGENLLPLYTTEKVEPRKEKHFYVQEDDFARPAIPTTITNYDELENIDLQQPVSMDIYRIKLKSRQFLSETVSSAPAHNAGSQQIGDGLRNMYLPTDGRDPNERLPHIDNKQTPIDPYFFNLAGSSNNFGNAFKQSERFNKPNVRLNDYIVDGVPVKYTERTDIQDELKWLKSLTLPTTARDLFIGRGINLPSNHATKMPRGKYNNDCSMLSDAKSLVSSNNGLPISMADKNTINSRSQMYSSMKIYTPGGGSVIINTKTPTNKTFSPENTPVLGGDMALVEVKEELMEEDNALDSVPENAFDPEDIIKTLQPNEDGSLDTSRFLESVRAIKSLVDYEKALISETLRSTDKITRDQANVLLKTVKIIIESNEAFRSNLASVDQEKLNSVLPKFLATLDPSKRPISMTELHESVFELLNLSVTIDQLKGLYSMFQNQIESEEKSDGDEIIQSHILLFIPFLCLAELNK